MPRQPKPLELRQRRNKASTRAKLRAGGVRAPALPTRGCVCGGPIEPPKPAGKRKRGRPPKPVEVCALCNGSGILPWHHLTRAWWARVWASPMAPEYIESDIDALYVLASLRDQFWRGGGVETKTAAEIRMQEARFGATPLDRRRLEWSLDKPEAEPEAEPAPPQPTGTDARALLRAVK